jgi:hypothetical protein
MQNLSIRDSFFDRESSLHGRLHTLRVMFWTKVLSRKVLNAKQGGTLWSSLPPDHILRAGELAFNAAVIHDCARAHDGKCLDHGLRAARTKRWILEESIYGGAVPDEDWAIIENALILHCRNEGELTGSVRDLTLAILKDADALDRVRLKREGPNPSYLRIPGSAGFILQAQALYDWTEAVNRDGVDWADLSGWGDRALILRST